MKKQAVLVQIIFFPKLPKAGIGGKTKGGPFSVLDRHPLRRIGNIQVSLLPQSFSGQPDGSVGDDCIHRASVGWGFPCGLVTWVQTNPRSNMTGTICDPGESCFDYL